MFDLTDLANGRRNTAPKRVEQVNEILKIIQKRLGSQINTAAFAVVGDFNDFPSPDCSLAKLFDSEYLKSIIENLPPDERWTHFWNNPKITEEEKYKQLDYIWLSKAITDQNNGIKPIINRQGLSKKAINPIIKKRYTEIESITKVIAASDHCCVSVKFNL
jgi:hypothetical protein